MHQPITRDARDCSNNAQPEEAWTETTARLHPDAPTLDTKDCSDDALPQQNLDRDRRVTAPRCTQPWTPRSAATMHCHEKVWTETAAWLHPAAQNIRCQGPQQRRTDTTECVCSDRRMAAPSRTKSWMPKTIAPIHCEGGDHRMATQANSALFENGGA